MSTKFSTYDAWIVSGYVREERALINNYKLQNNKKSILFNRSSNQILVDELTQIINT